jgi:hypothetical protein
LPDIFLAIEFGRAWRQLQERDVAWNLEGLGAMPAGLIEKEDSVSARSDFGCDLIEVKLHSFGIATRRALLASRRLDPSRSARQNFAVGAPSWEILELGYGPEPKLSPRPITLQASHPRCYWRPPHKRPPSREALALWIGLRPFRQVADTSLLGPADNQPNPCNTDTSFKGSDGSCVDGA